MTFIERPHENEKNRALSYIAKLLDEARNSKDERAGDIKQLEEIQKLLSIKKYGLIWEEHAEKFEEDMKGTIPMFVENDNRKIHDDNESNNFNFLLEGDNLHSLHLLEKTHQEKIDVIYIDPPYNTGAKDWRYNNDFVDGTNNFRHSKWISFIHRRIQYAKRLLSERGIIVVSIDHYELANLIELMDEEFGEKNRIGIVSVIHKPEGRNQEKFFGTSNEFALFYAKEKSKASFRNVLINNDPSEYDRSDVNGVYKLKNFIRMSDGKYATKEAKPNFWYPIYISRDLKDYSLSEKNGYLPVYPVTSSGIKRTWKTLPKSFKKYWDEGNIEVLESNGSISIFEKQRPNEVIKTHWLKTEYHAYHHGTKILTEILGEKKFDFPKSTTLIKDILKLTSYHESIILDFFAGSGTTGQAVVELNQEDGGNRKFILATNNENKIAEEVTYERMKRVSSGTDKYEAHPMNLKYFKTDFIDKQVDDLENSLLANVKTLIELKHGIDLDDSDIAIVTKRSDINELDVSNLSTIYMRSQTHKMLDRQQLEELKEIKIIDIPETFFPLEMKEAGL